MPQHCETTFVREIVPDTDITPLELLLLSHIFHAERRSAGWQFYAQKGLPWFVYLDRAAVETALAASQAVESGANGLVSAQFTKAGPADGTVEIDLMESSWEFLFQDIVRRSARLRYVSVVFSLWSSEIGEENFGGVAWVITPDKVLAKSTNDIIADFLREENIPSGRGFLPPTWKSPLDLS